MTQQIQRTFARSNLLRPCYGETNVIDLGKTCYGTGKSPTCYGKTGVMDFGLMCKLPFVSYLFGAFHLLLPSLVQFENEFLGHFQSFHGVLAVVHRQWRGATSSVCRCLWRRVVMAHLRTSTSCRCTSYRHSQCSRKRVQQLKKTKKSCFGFWKKTLKK